jgi:site-specific DNA-methyltransferase (adenine-specific)
VIHHGDLFDVLPKLVECSVDACVTDPPYDLTANKRGGSGAASINLERRARIGTGNGAGGFMGKAWDGTGVAFKPETWREVYRVLKPGAHLVAFGGTRTFHRMTCAIEDAGFEIRDCLSWLYGQGFPKSLNMPGGLGTALKPSWEPIILARKPTQGTVAANVLKHGTAALNIDACRIDTGGEVVAGSGKSMGYDNGNPRGRDTGGNVTPDIGRWPANVLLDEEAAALLDEQTGELVSGDLLPGHKQGAGSFGRVGGDYINGKYGGDRGGASRFYYVAKPSRAERDMGCEGLTARTGGEATDRKDGSAGLDNPRAGAGRTGGARNIHPTVKPVELMRWLVKLVTPPGATVLDPFTGSGTTGMACRYEDRRFIGIEREAEYVAIAERRIAAVAPLFAEATA